MNDLQKLATEIQELRVKVRQLEKRVEQYEQEPSSMTFETTLQELRRQSLASDVVINIRGLER